MTGTATDDIGINAGRLVFKDAQGRYLQDDGSADGAYNSFTVSPDVIGAQAATWSYEVTLPYESEWEVQSYGIDTAGQSSLDSSNRSWIVSANAVAPTVAISACWLPCCHRPRRSP